MYQKLDISLDGGQVLTWQVLNTATDTWVDMLYTGSSQKRSGIPVLFPFANPLTNNIFNYSGYEMPQHGFGRLSQWEFDNPISEILDNTISLRLDSSKLDAVWQKAFPYDFVARITVTLIGTTRLQYSLRLDNKNPGKPIPIAPGIHPYFKVAHSNKIDIQSTLCPDIQSVIDWNKESTGYFVDFLGEVVFDFPHYSLHMYNDQIHPAKNLVIWSQPHDYADCDFVCLEPFCCDTNAINDNPIWVNNSWEITWGFEVKVK